VVLVVLVVVVVVVMLEPRTGQQLAPGRFPSHSSTT